MTRITNNRASPPESIHSPFFFLKCLLTARLTSRQSTLDCRQSTLDCRQSSLTVPTTSTSTKTGPLHRLMD
jgi:hypothetical protein